MEVKKKYHVLHRVETASCSSACYVRHSVLKQSEEILILVILFLPNRPTVSPQQITQVHCMNGWAGFLVQLGKDKITVEW